jgi:leucyl/phenylalanyl-tRNA--protein transferase
MQLTLELLLAAYSQGIFPMAHEDGEIYWYDPDPRAILPLDRFHVARSLARTMKGNRFEVSYNGAFEAVIRACARPGLGREESWINEDIMTAYSQLHEFGFAYSVETWLEGELAGGLYGVAIRGLFAGESMFSRATDASKVALVYLVERLKEGGFQLLDVQFMTEHLRRLGAIEISRKEYKRRLAQALQVPARW